MPVWEYAPTNGYTLIQKYQSITEVQLKYYGAKYPMFRNHNKIHILPNGNILLTQNVHSLTETWVNKQIRIMNDPFAFNGKNKNEGVDVLNESGEVIAWFANTTMIDKLKDKTSSHNAYIAVNKDCIPNVNITGIYYRKSTKTYQND
jgi:hypothetical protein